MKLLAVAVFLVLGITVASGAESSAVVKREAEKCAAALLRSDYEGMVTYTHKRVVAGIGGKAAFIATIKRGVAEMKAEGTGFESVSIGVAEEPTKVGTWLISRVPQHIVMTVPGGHLHTDSYLLGISEDDGVSWVFIDLGPIRKAQFAQIFPELDGKVTLPPRMKPEFRKD